MKNYFTTVLSFISSEATFTSMEQGNKEFVSLENLIAFISSYIQQKKERLGYRCRIDFDCECNQEGQYEIAPMVLITFIEMAFKHEG